MLLNQPQTPEQREIKLRRSIFASSYSGCRPSADEIAEAGEEYQNMIWTLADLEEDFPDILAREQFAEFQAAIRKTPPHMALLEANFDQDQIRDLSTWLWDAPEFGLQFLHELDGFAGTATIGRAIFEEAGFGAKAFLDDKMYHQALLLQVLLQQEFMRRYWSPLEISTA